MADTVEYQALLAFLSMDSKINLKQWDSAVEQVDFRQTQLVLEEVDSPMVWPLKEETSSVCLVEPNQTPFSGPHLKLLNQDSSNLGQFPNLVALVVQDLSLAEQLVVPQQMIHTLISP